MPHDCSPLPCMRTLTLVPLLWCAACGDPVAVRGFLSIVNTSPSGGAADLPVDLEVLVTFSEPVEVSSLTPETVYLETEAEGLPVEATLTYEEDWNTVLLTPSEELSYETGYTLVLTTGVSGATSGALPVAVQSSFATGADDRPSNRAPTADAGSDQEVMVGDTVILDGSASSDPDGDDITYLWTPQLLPEGSEASLDDDSIATPSFVADVAGTFVFSLVAKDESFQSQPAYVQVTAVEEGE